VSAERVTALDQTAPGVAAAIHGVMQEAYVVEAGLLGAEDFVPLRRSVGDIAGSRTRFLGVRVDGALAAVAELDEARPDVVGVDALVVRPQDFRTGLGTALLREIIAQADGRTVTVSTAAANTPALDLYASLGLFVTDTWTTADGIRMLNLATAPNRAAAGRRDTKEAHE
jgi:GNAT superfamily N-acetyltransferase